MTPGGGEELADWRADRVGSARRGENPTVLLRMRTGWAVIGDTQHLPGYCVLLHDGSADRLTELPRRDRAGFLADLSLLGEAVEAVCSARDAACTRANYEVLGNAMHHLHGHVHARYRWEPEHRRSGPVWLYGPERFAPEHALGPRHDGLRAELAAALRAITAEAYAPGTPGSA
ncbi:HIT domain-containing protein [Nocardiopsis halophila]|uniref:HIT domain-containing protein n=1 Tax=Nocardiopsis halophila TaxID=141692 RepID=UPI00034BDCCC|nr:HIT domain-containing protein [Nocardiopsis halophila]